MKLVESCSCNWLTENFNPMEPKSKFNELDELVIIWCKLIDVTTDCNVDMVCKNSTLNEVVKISVPIKRTTEKEPARRVWTVMDTKATNVFHSFVGKWIVDIMSENTLLASESFEYCKIANREMLLSNNSIFDISI